MESYSQLGIFLDKAIGEEPKVSKAPTTSRNTPVLLNATSPTVLVSFFVSFAVVRCLVRARRVSSVYS